MHFVVPSVGSKLLVPLLVNQTPLLLCCVIDGFLPNGIEFFSALDGVLEFPLMLFLSLVVAFGESNPTPSIFVVLLMVFFLAIQNFRRSSLCF